MKTTSPLVFARVFALAIALAVVGVHAQEPLCSPYGVDLAFCNDVMVDDNVTLAVRDVFSITGLASQDDIAEALLNMNSSSSVWMASALPYQCAVTYLNLVCSTGYRACYPDPRGFTTYRSVCRSVCDEFVATCGGFLSAVQHPLPADFCLQPDPNVPTNPLYPESSAPSVVPAPPPAPPLVTDDVPCYPAEVKVFVEYPCPPDLEFAPERATEGNPFGCQNTCPPSFTSESDKEAAFIAAAVGSWMSFVCFIYMLLTYTIFKSNRVWPRRIFIYVILSTMLFNIANMMAVFVEWQEEVCNTTSFYCILQAILVGVARCTCNVCARGVLCA
jgi:hypothetical protein